MKTSDVLIKLRANEKPPRSAMLALTKIPVTFEEGGATGDAKSIKVNIKARQRGAIDHPWWGTVYHDLSTMRSRPKIAIDDTHGDEIGHGRPYQTEYGLEVDGTIFTNPENPEHPANRVAYNLRNGIPQEGSIDFTGDYDVLEVPEGMSYPVNGIAAKGPCLVVMNWPLRAVAICKEGADASTNTEAALAASDKSASPRNITTLANPEPQKPQEEEKMKIKCGGCGSEFELAATHTDPTVECPSCKVKLDAKTGSKLSAEPVKPGVDANAVAAAEAATKAAVEAAAATQTQLTQKQQEIEAEKLKAQQLQSHLDDAKARLDAATRASGAPPIPAGKKPGEGAGAVATWKEAVEKVMKDSPKLTATQAFAKAVKLYPQLQKAAIIHREK